MQLFHSVARCLIALTALAASAIVSAQAGFDGKTFSDAFYGLGGTDPVSNKLGNVIAAPAPPFVVGGGIETTFSYHDEFTNDVVTTITADFSDTSLSLVLHILQPPAEKMWGVATFSGLVFNVNVAAPGGPLTFIGSSVDSTLTTAMVGHRSVDNHGRLHGRSGWLFGQQRHNRLERPLVRRGHHGGRQLHSRARDVRVDGAWPCGARWRDAVPAQRGQGLAHP
jgi:hypothetical protein